MKEELMKALIDFVITVLGIASTAVLIAAQKYIQEKKLQLIEQGKAEQFNRALNIAKGIYLALEDEFKYLEKAGEYKKAEMEKRLLDIIPGLTSVELQSINKQIWQEFNDKIIKEITPIDTNKTQ